MQRQNNRSIFKGLGRKIKEIKLASGYIKMGNINRQIANEFIFSDNDTLAEGEQKLTECEK